MPRPTKGLSGPKQPPPVAFRPPPELAVLLNDFAAAHGLNIHEAAKSLVSLAVIGLDARYYPLIQLLALGRAGPNAFVRAALSARTATQAAARFAPQVLGEPGRTDFLASYIRDSLGSRTDPVLGQVLKMLFEDLGRTHFPADTEVPAEPSRASETKPGKRFRRKVRRAGDKEAVVREDDMD